MTNATRSCHETVTQSAPVQSATRQEITTIIFDVDDTLYDVGTGFAAHRNTDGVTDFMVQKFNFPSKEVAQALRDEYFQKYHSTAKTLTMIEKDGKLPTVPKGAKVKSPRFNADDLDEFWATKLNFSLLGGPDPKCIKMFDELSASSTPLNIIGFSNAPRKYAMRVLEELSLSSYFPHENFYSVTDVLPYCKPEKEAFELIFEKGGVRPEECVMVEDSMKNIRAAKAIGMKTILIAGKGRIQGGGENVDAGDADTTKPGDAPDLNDPAVDAAVEVASEVGDVVRQWMK